VRRDHEGGVTSEAGITLVEVIISIFILSVALFALASTATTSLISLGESRDREQATNAASATIEAARARDFGALVIDAAATPSGLPAAILTQLGISGSCAGTERIVQDAASSEPLPLSQQAGDNDRITVYTLVTWADEPCTATTGAMKRVVALATWNDRGTLRSVRNETLVAPAGRGLPVPNFEVKPGESTLSLTPEQAAAGAVGERCIEQQLRNLGASDRYELDVVSVAGGTGTSSLLGASWTVAGDWTVRAFLEHPAVPSRGGAPPTDGLMQDGDLNGRPESDAQLEARDQATVTICYRALVGSAAEDVTVEYDVVSRFDERRTERLTHHVSVGDPTLLLHLQDRDDTQPHVRAAAGGNDAKKYPPYRMNPLNPASGDRSQLLGADLYAWGTELYDVPGLPLRRAQLDKESALLRTVDFRYGVPAPARLLPGGDLRIWTAPVNHLLGAPTVPTRLRLTVELDVLNEDETARVWPSAGPFTTTLDYDHSGSGYQLKDIPLAFTDSFDLAANQKLRLRLTCATESGADCVVGYDAAAQPAYLRVALQ
jgi:type II secretory pathway pseudopilin PulG